MGDWIDTNNKSGYDLKKKGVKRVTATCETRNSVIILGTKKKEEEREGGCNLNRSGIEKNSIYNTTVNILGSGVGKHYRTFCLYIIKKNKNN